METSGQAESELKQLRELGISDITDLSAADL